MIIAIEGGDQAGKKTQSLLLYKRLKQQMAVKLFSFPDYTTPVGSKIKAILDGSGRPPPKEIHRLMAENRREKLVEISGCPEGTILIMNRYTPSNIAYGLANGGLDRGFLEDLDRDMPKPDLVILLDIDPQKACDRKMARRDIFESNMELADAVRQRYQDLAHEQSWKTVDAVDTKQAVHKKILDIVAPMLHLSDRHYGLFTYDSTRKACKP